MFTKCRRGENAATNAIYPDRTANADDFSERRMLNLFERAEMPDLGISKHIVDRVDGREWEIIRGKDGLPVGPRFRADDFAELFCQINIVLFALLARLESRILAQYRPSIQCIKQIPPELVGD
ncbi:MAG: hypothetical protein JOZ94_13510 [Xanthobacteraceae bacterium]|nr:hypothetical protein [Xanthobacteraceae bacterium]